MMFFGCLPCCGGGGGACPKLDELLALDTLTVHYKISTTITNYVNGILNISSTSEREETVQLPINGPGGTVGGLMTITDSFNTDPIPRYCALDVATNRVEGVSFPSHPGLQKNSEYALRFLWSVSGGRQNRDPIFNAEVFVIPCGAVIGAAAQSTLHGFFIGTQRGWDGFTLPLWGQSHNYSYGEYGSSSFSGARPQISSCLISSGSLSGLPVPHNLTPPTLRLSLLRSRGDLSSYFYEQQTVSLELYNYYGSDGSYLPVPSDENSSLISQNWALV
jgi:hypothetical protein